MTVTVPALIVAEPQRFYCMPPVVVDCSVLAALLFDEPGRDAAAEALADHTLHAPWLLDIEMASVASKKNGAGKPDLARQGLGDYVSLTLKRHPVDPRAVLELAQAYGLTAYDAAYLQLAASLQAPLLTFDRKLGIAAQTYLGSKNA